MATRVDTLTPEQTAQLQQWADRWIGIGLSTDPADFDAFEGHARRAYEAAGLEWPGIVIRVSSPLAAAYAVPLTALVLDGLRRGGQVGDQVRDQVLGQVRGQVRGQVGDQVRDQVRDQVGDQVGDQVRDQVLGQVRDQVRDQVGDQVLGQVERWILDRWHWDSGWWITWLAWATYFRDACHLDMPGALWDRVGPLEHAAQAAWAWWPQEDYVVVCDRPLVVHRQATGETGWGSHRLHCTDGPAVAFRDGWAVWAIEGVRVTEQIVMRPETITVDQIWGEPNAEVRRVMIERHGWAEFVESAGLTLVHTEPDPGNPGHTLALYDLPGQVFDEPVRVVVVTNASPERDGTRRRYGLTVPADIDEAAAGIAWTFGIDPATYRGLARAT